jgi:hypothetical protein
MDGKQSLCLAVRVVMCLTSHMVPIHNLFLAFVYWKKKCMETTCFSTTARFRSYKRRRKRGRTG